MSIIDRGARAEYLYLATRLPAVVLVTGFLYAMALWIVLLVVKVQATSIVAAAGVDFGSRPVPALTRATQSTKITPR